VEALQKSIEGSLAAVFRHGTIEYNRYRDASPLDQGPISTTSDYIVARSAPPGRGSHEDFHQYLAEGKHRAILLLGHAIRELKEERADRGGWAEAPLA
jgi:hypothetical protein